jgi:flavin-dependent dehydrogenase
MPATVAIGPIGDGNSIEGVRVRTSAGEAEIRAGLTLLATGANATALDAFGLQVSMKPSGVAGRAYFEAPPELVQRYSHLTIAYDREWCPGYGWIFPAPGSRFNIGVGLFSSEDGPSRLRDFWAFFQSRNAHAAEIIAASQQVTPFRGAPLRTGLVGARFGTRGLVVIGEAAAMTYPGTGEGIGKAMESGIMAARFVADALAGRAPIDAVTPAYEAEFRRRFASRYHAYQRAQRWAGSPFLLNLLAYRANAGRFVRRELEALVDERGDASALFSRRRDSRTAGRSCDGPCRA